jgi:NADPH2:quinone reductase
MKGPVGSALVVSGVGAGSRVELDLFPMMVKRLRLLASTLRMRSFEQRAEVMRRVEREVIPLVDRGVVDIPVTAWFPLDRAPEAYERFRADGKLGKVVIALDGRAARERADEDCVG